MRHISSAIEKCMIRVYETNGKTLKKSCYQPPPQICKKKRKKIINSVNTANMIAKTQK